MREGFSDSLLGSAAIASQPHPERKSVLVERNALLLTDMPAASTSPGASTSAATRSTPATRAIERVHAAD